MSSISSMALTKSSKFLQVNKTLQQPQHRVTELEVVGDPHLPVELLGLISCYLSRKELWICCATSRIMRTFSRAHLLRTVAITNGTSPSLPDDDTFVIDTIQLKKIMTIFPDIGKAVRSLTLFQSSQYYHVGHWIYNRFIADCVELCTFLSSCSYIETFSISRSFEDKMGFIGNRREWKGLEPRLQEVIPKIMNLPTLKELIIHEIIIFESPQSFCDQFNLEHRSAIVNVEIFGGYFEKPQLLHNLKAASSQAILESLKLAYVNEYLWPLMFTSPASPFNVSHLKSLELSSLGPRDDHWIATLLDAQESTSRLVHLALLGVEGYPQHAKFLQSLERFTSIRTLNLSENPEPRQLSYEKPTNLDCLPFWLYSLPIRNTVEELVIRETDLQHVYSTIASLDEMVTDKDIMPRLHRLVLKITLTDMWWSPVIEAEFEDRFLTAKSKGLIEIQCLFGERVVWVQGNEN